MADCRHNLLVDRWLSRCGPKFQTVYGLDKLRNLSAAWMDYTKTFDSTSYKLVVETALKPKSSPKNNGMRPEHDVVVEGKIRASVSEAQNWAHHLQTRNLPR